MQEIDQVALIQSIKQGNKQALQRLYLAHRMGFADWARIQYGCSEEEAIDIFQDVMIVFYENITEGKIEQLKGSVRNYLFGIGKFKLLEHFRKQTRWVSLPDREKQEIGEALTEEDTQTQLELTERQEQLKQILRALGSPCQEILQWFYYHKFSTESIMMRLGYKSTDVVKSQKARCMRTLRKKIETATDLDLQ